MKNKRTAVRNASLVRYWWVILIVIGMFGTIWAFTYMVISLLMPVPSDTGELSYACIFPSHVLCTYDRFSPSQIKLTFENGAGRDMIITEVDASSKALDTKVNLGCCSTGAIYTILKNGAIAEFTLNKSDAACPNWCNVSNSRKGKNKYNITATYLWADSPTMSHQFSGVLWRKNH